ncbi:MAG TPA: CHAP domain-containing protein [Rhizomicrobium sp.]|jgi:hypothetical protein|nr:CHAP domain-containing protein [Rhizomicrobium sp.]
MTPKAIRLPLIALFIPILFLSIPQRAVAQEGHLAADAALAPSVEPVQDRTTESAEAVAEIAPPSAETPAPPAPTVEWPLKRLYCVEYARLRSGLAIFGDAKLWWTRAKNLYEEFAEPAVDAVMVFSGSKRIRRGHVAVVTHIVSPREIIVDHANWQNRGEIDLHTPVLDVSAQNDWSEVRVWDIAAGHFGAHVYRVSGFIGRPAAAPAVGS